MSIVEVCVASLESALAAASAGAHRIELNTALQLDGLTPSSGLVHGVRAAVQLPIIAMARPRAGDFDYDEWEWQTLMADAKWLLENGADGIAFGCVSKSGEVQTDRLQQMAELCDRAGQKELVFHKAFDVTADWEVALSQLALAGVVRVMTSAGEASAAGPAAARKIGEMVKIAQGLGSLEILPGGGITSENVGELVDISGVRQVHGTFSRGNQSGDRAGLESEIRRVLATVAD